MKKKQGLTQPEVHSRTSKKDKSETTSFYKNTESPQKIKQFTNNDPVVFYVQKPADTSLNSEPFPELETDKKEHDEFWRESQAQNKKPFARRKMGSVHVDAHIAELLVKQPYKEIEEGGGDIKVKVIKKFKPVTQ